MKRRSKASSGAPKAQGRKTATLKRRKVSNEAGRRSSSAAAAEGKVVRLSRELSEARDQQTATGDVLKVISRASFDLQAMLDTLVKSAARLCEADLVAIHRPRDGAMHFAANFGLSHEWEEIVKRAPIVPGRGTATGRVLLTGKVVQIADVEADPEYTFTQGQKAGGFRTVLAVPLEREGETIGVIVLCRTKVRPFTDKQIELVQNFAAQAVIAIENARLLNELQQRTDDLTERTADLTELLEQQTATSEVLRVISSSRGELQPVFHAMLENAVRICGAKFGNIHRWDGDVLRLVATHNTPPAYAEIRKRYPFHPAADNPSSRMLRSKTVIHGLDLLEEETYIKRRDPGTIAAVEIGGVRTFLIVPMLKGGELIGSLNLFRQEVRPFTEKQIELVTNFAAQAVIAIENARLLSELRQRTTDLTEALDQQTATSEVLRVISSSPGEPQPVFEAMLESATRICEANFGAIFRLENGAVRMVTRLRVPERLSQFLQKHGDSFGPLHPWSRLIQSRRTLHIADYSNDRAYLERDPVAIAGVELGGLRTLLAVPMLKDDELVGFVTIFRQEVRPFTDKQIELVTNFANQAVIAIENTRLLSELRESLQQQTATADVLKVISRSTFDLQTVLHTLVESAARLCDADKATITRKKGEVFYRAEAYGFTSEFMDYVRSIPVEPERGSAHGRALLEGRIIHIPDVQADPEYTFVEAQRLSGFRTVLCVPMLREGIPIGVLALTRSEVRSFTDKQIELVSTFADQAAIAIENVRLFESREARTRELAKSLEDLRTAQDRLVQTEKLASLGQLTAGIAHEIKNPLNFVNNFSAVSVELIDELREALGGVHLDSKLRAEISEIADTLQGNLDKVVQHGKRADAIVKNMLLHSRQGSGEHRPVDINALVDESLNLAYHGATG